MTWTEAMTAGNRALAAGDPAAAYRAFGSAHDLGHEIRRQHLAAHRGMIHAGWQARRIDQIARNVLLMSAASVFDWQRAPASA